MAQDFRRYKERNIGITGGVRTILTANSYDTIIGIRVANVHSSSSTNVSVYINDGSNDFYIAKAVPIPAGSSIEFIDGGAKMVLENNDVLKISSTVDFVDAWVSCVDAISS